MLRLEPDGDISRREFAADLENIPQLYLIAVCRHRF
jgi:hypothetical protein